MSAFYMDVYDAAGVKQNDTATELANVSTTDRINRIGEVTFTLPAHLARDMALQPGRRYKLYHSTLGYLGVFRHDNLTVDADNLTATVTALDSLVDLDNLCCGFNWAYNGTSTISTIISALCTYAGWTVSYETGFTDSYPAIEWQGESVLTALDRLRQFTRGYFRRESDTSIKFGLFQNLGNTWNSYGGFIYGSGLYKGDPAGVPADTQAWLLNPPVMSADIEGATAIYATITALRRESKGAAIVNRVFALGAGQGQTQLNLSHSNRSSPYARQSRLNEDGSTYAYYIEDSSSITAYGAVERVLAFNDIRPITNSAADLLAAGNALYDMAAAYLERFSVPQEIYSVSCVGLPATVKPGDIIVLNYYGVVEEADGANAYLTLENAPFYVVEIARDYGESGNPVAQLVISTSGEAQATTVDVFTHVLQDLDKFKVRPQPSQTYFTKVAPPLPIAASKNVVFKFYLGPEVLLLNEMRIEFRVMPLRSMASNATSSTTVVGSTDPGGAAAPTTDPESAVHNHQLTLAGLGGGYMVMTDGSQLGYSAGPGGVNTAANASTHTHSVSIGAHSHAFGAGSAHTHALSFGVVDDTAAPNTLAVYVNGTLAGNIRNVETGANMGTSVSAAGLYDVDILSLLTAGAWRETTHTIEFSCVSGQGQVFAQVLGRITIQPIAVS